MNLKGTLPFLILHILQHGGPNHGYQINKIIREESKGVLNFKEGTLYPTLKSLEEQQLVYSYTIPGETRKRRYYKITPQGKKVLLQDRVEWQQYKAAVESVLRWAAVPPS